MQDTCTCSILHGQGRMDLGAWGKRRAGDQRLLHLLKRG